MNISQIRTHFNSEIQAYDSSLVEWRDSLNIDNIPSNLINTRYHIAYDSGSGSPANDTSLEENWNIIVTLMRRAPQKETATFMDEIVDTAHCIRLAVLDPKTISVTDNIKRIDSTGFSPEEISDTNDNIIKVSLSFNVLMYFNI